MFINHMIIFTAIILCCLNIVSGDNGDNYYVDKNDNILEVDAYDNEDATFLGDEPVQLKEDAKGNADNSKSCWMSLNAKSHFDAMDNLDRQYAGVKKAYQDKVGDKMDSQMLKAFLEARGAAHRTVFRADGDPGLIPAGMNLGGHGMMRLKNSLLFFHRMKLRNSTNFQVNYLHNDLENMALIARLALNDLHLVGAYERSATNEDLTVLYYRPAFGQLELLLKNVDYKMEGRLRMTSDRITIELINSELVINDEILMMYGNEYEVGGPELSVKLERRNIDDFLERLKTDLDLWLKDYFNDYLMYYLLPKVDNTKIQEYEDKKTVILNDYITYAIVAIRQKIVDLGGEALLLPGFTIYSIPNMVLKIKDGVLRGLDSLYQRSVGTCRKIKKVRLVDVIVGFSKLKVEYTFEAVLPNGLPSLTGALHLSANELTAHLGISLVKSPETVDLTFDFIQQLKPESLTVEGSANRLIASFKHQLENQILAIMSNTLMHNVKMLNTITRCVPFIFGYADYINKTNTQEHNIVR